MTGTKVAAGHRWRVPYSTGATHGFLIVAATGREDAINAAIATHGNSRRLYDGHGVRRTTSIRLTPRQRAAIQYGEPEQLAAQPTQAGAA